MYHDPLDPDTIRTDDEARDAASERYEARLAAGDARPPVRATSLPEPRAHCLTFRVEISAELPSPVLDTLTLARETSYDGHRAEPLRVMQALEPLVLSLLALMQGLPGNVADTEETAGAFTVTIGSPRARGEIARRYSFATTLQAERGERQRLPNVRHQFTECIQRACRDYDLLCADEFPPPHPAIAALVMEHGTAALVMEHGTASMRRDDTTPACC